MTYWGASQSYVAYLKVEPKQGYLRDLDNRVGYNEIELQKCIEDSHFSSVDRSKLWRKVNELEVKVNQFSQLHLNIKRAIFAFGKKRKNILRVTLRLNN